MDREFRVRSLELLIPFALAQDFICITGKRSNSSLIFANKCRSKHQKSINEIHQTVANQSLIKKRYENTANTMIIVVSIHKHPIEITEVEKSSSQFLNPRTLETRLNLSLHGLICFYPPKFQNITETESDYFRSEDKTSILSFCYTTAISIIFSTAQGIKWNSNTYQLHFQVSLSI